MAKISSLCISACMYQNSEKTFISAFLALFQLAEQIFCIQCTGKHLQRAIGQYRPLFPRPVPIQFHAIAIRIVQINRFRYAMVAGSGDGVAGSYQSRENLCQLLAGGIQDSKMVQAGCMQGSSRSMMAVPRIQSDMVMIAAGRKKDRLMSVTHGNFKTQQVVIESKRFFQISNFQMHVPDTRLRRYLIRRK